MSGPAHPPDADAPRAPDGEAPRAPDGEAPRVPGVDVLRAPGPREAPIARQLVRRVLVPLLVGALVFVVPLVVLTVRDARSQLAQQAELRAATLALLSQDVLASARPEALAELALLPGERVGIIVGGTQVAGNGPLPAAALSSDVVTAALDGTIGSARLGELDAVVAAAPLVQRAQTVGVAVTVLPTADADARVRNVTLVLVLLSSALLVLAVVSSRAFARTIVRPVARLDEVAAELAAGNLGVRAPTDLGPAELRRLAVTLNRSAERVGTLLAQQRRFVADASHQLRTPLTGLRLRLEAAQDVAIAERSGPDDDHDIARLGAAIAEVDRLTRLVGDLLLLARAEEDRTPPALLDVGAVVRERVASWAPVGAEQDVEVVADLPDPPGDHTGPGVSVAEAAGPALPPVLVAAGALEQVLDNLLANALRAASPGTRVGVVARSEPAPPDADAEVEVGRTEVVLRVIDRGPGMTEEQRRRAFDRFWRAADAPPGGSGLGLAIVDELVRRNGGQVYLRDHTGGGLVAEVRLPAASVVSATTARSDGGETSTASGR